MKKLRTSMRLVGAIAAKDILDALKNKATLMNIIITLLMLFFYRMMPLMDRPKFPNVLVYDAGSARLTAALERSECLYLYTYPSQASMKRYLANGNVPELGLVIPADFDAQVTAGTALKLDGYVLHWVSDSAAQELKRYVETEIESLVGRPVTILLGGHQIYPLPDSGGFPFIAALTMVIAVLFIGITVVPHLMIEEKQSKTLDALLVSPANIVHIVLGKTFTGLFYGLTCTTIVLVLFNPLVVHWGATILVTCLGVLFGVGVGILLGSWLEVRAQLMLWAMVVSAGLLMPSFLVIMDELLPDIVNQILTWVPSVVLLRAFRTTLTNTIPWSQFGADLAMLAGWTGLLFALIVWRIRQRSA